MAAPFSAGLSMSFAALGLTPSLVRAVADSGYAAPTEIQIAAIPAILKGTDVLAAAPTGTGKTAAFALPILQLAIKSTPSARSPHALILVPTRELAAQVGEVLRSFARSMTEQLKIVVAAGGVSINPQMLALRGHTQIVVATPGRLLDLADHNAIQLSEVHTLVLDEADRLLDLGFADELNRIVSMLPANRQNLLFSATFPASVQALTEQLLHDPYVIKNEPAASSTPAITQRSILVDKEARTPLLRHLLKTEQWPRALVFVATQYSTEHIADKLRRNHITAAALHGELSQGARNKALAEFKSSQLQVLVATDLAGRGIDIEDLPAVVNYDLPRSADDYTHRIGRTGRAGATGTVVSFVSAETEAHFRLIEKRQRFRVPREQISGFEPSAAIVNPTDTSGGIKGKRKSKKDKQREAAQARVEGTAAGNSEPVEQPSVFVWPARPAMTDSKPD